jgi:hypothetical protein
VWVRLYQPVDANVDVSVVDTDGVGPRTMKLRAMGSPFEIEPVPRNINALCKAVKDEWGERLPFAAPELVVYNLKTQGADDEIEISADVTTSIFRAGDKVPEQTTDSEPLVVVAPAITASTSTTARHKAARTTAARKLAQQFVKSIMADLMEIPDSNGMKVMNNVVDLETGKVQDVVIRRITADFWSECIRLLNDEKMEYRVCAVGTPGIGKTTSTPLLIRMLLMDEQTVVYLVRTKEKTSWYYEFIPQSNNDVVVNVYPEYMSSNDIASLKKKETFHIVDPGKTMNTCDYDNFFQAKLLIVSSPDEGHWGGGHFSKRRNNCAGKFRYFPVWDLEELQLARTTLSIIVGARLTAEDVEVRYRQVGGVPRKVFSPDLREMLDAQDRAIRVLNAKQVISIASKCMDALGSFAPGEPKSSLIGYETGDTDFSTANISIISPLVAEKIYKTFMKDLWNEMYSTSFVGIGKVFETYCRSLMAEKSTPQVFDCRPCCGMRSQQYANVRNVTLGGCSEVRMVQDIPTSAKNHPMILFHSTDPRHQLYDFMYYNSTDDKFCAFQATTGQTHTIRGLADLKKILASATLELYYLVPEELFDKFVTKPVKPATDKLTRVWHVCIPKPA